MLRQLACQYCLHLEQSIIQESADIPQGQLSKSRCEVEMLGGGGTWMLVGVDVVTVPGLLVLLKSGALILCPCLFLPATPLPGLMIEAMLGVLGGLYLLAML